MEALIPHGFTKNKYARTHMILYPFEVCGGLDLQTLATLYLDFKKFMDKVCHEGLLEKLRNRAVTGGGLDLLKSYLIGRSQSAKMVSEPQVKSRVPQGTELRPFSSTSS